MAQLVTTIIRITKKQQESIKSAKRSEGFQLSPFVRNQLDKKFFGDPDFIQNQIDSNDTIIQELKDINERLSEEKTDVMEKIERKKQRLQKPERIDYGGLERKKPKGDKKHGPSTKG